MTPTINAIIVELLVILFMHVLVRKKKFMTWLRFQKEPLLTIKDPKSYGHQKPQHDFCMYEWRKYKE
jgi:hypothetical protein